MLDNIAITEVCNHLTDLFFFSRRLTSWSGRLLIFYTMKYLPALIFLMFLSCNQKEKVIKSKKGQIQIINNIYFNASKGLDDMKSFYVSKLNYHNNYFIEIIPDIDIPGIDNEAHFIKDSIFYPLGAPEEISKLNIIEHSKKNKAYSISLKKNGAVFTKDSIPFYSQRVNINDTILFKKKYKRFEIKTPQFFSRYYVYQTDTILPYSLNRTVEKDYKGRIERIDTYLNKDDLFITLQLILNKEWDKEAKDFFEYTEFLKQKHNE